MFTGVLNLKCSAMVYMVVLPHGSLSCVLLWVQVDVLRADLESAEWRVLESWVQDGTLKMISQLLLTIHLQWAGFEVSGSEVEVVRFWYSVLSALHSSGFRLTHSAHGSGHTILGHELPDTHSSYTLSWVRLRESDCKQRPGTAKFLRPLAPRQESQLWLFDHQNQTLWGEAETSVTVLHKAAPKTCLIKQVTFWKRTYLYIRLCSTSWEIALIFAMLHGSLLWCKQCHFAL